ncbi:MAG: hypothetical protein ACO1OF_16435 [Adhaeribacter sp.]
MKLNLHSESQDIINYLLGKKAELSQPLIDKLQRLHVCADLIKKHGSRLVVVPKLVKLYEPLGGYSYQTAQRDFDDTQEIFGATPHSSKDFWFDLVIGMMMETRQKCLDKEDYKTAATIEYRILKGVEAFIGDKEVYPLDQLQPQDIQVGFFPELLKVKLPENLEFQLKKIIESKRKKDLMIDDAQILTDESAG